MPAGPETTTGSRLLATPELVGFLESGVIMYVATRSADLEPEAVPGVGAKVDVGTDHLTVYVPEPAAAVTMANLRDNAQIALATVDVTNHKSLQLKGEFVSARPTDEADHEI